MTYKKDGCRILYEDSEILLCCKRAGLAVQSARLGEKDLVSILKTYLRESGQASAQPYLGVVHRLDQPVRGIVLFAKNAKAAGALSQQLNDGRMEKFYLAVIRLTRQETAGSLTKGTLVDYLIKDSRTNVSRVVPEGTPGAKKAELEYRCLERYDASGEIPASALLEIRLHTGRHHQIRVQMAHAGMPLAGDRKYGPGGDGEPRFPLLCAWKLVFDHPGTGKRMCFLLDKEDIGFPDPLPALLWT